MPTCKNNPNRYYKGTEPSPKGRGYCASGETIGTRKKGTDGSMWIVKASGNTQRWVRQGSAPPSKQHDQKDQKQAIILHMVMVNRWMKKYHLISASKKNVIAENRDKTIKQLRSSVRELLRDLIRMRLAYISLKDLKDVVSLVSLYDKKKLVRMLELEISDRQKFPVSDYMGLWKPRPKTFMSYTRKQLITEALGFNEAWNNIAFRDQQMYESEMKTMPMKDLRELVEYYYESDSKMAAASHLRRRLKNLQK